jgi:hypothetical protein
MSLKVPPHFLHPVGFRNDRNVKRLIKDFSVEGYGAAVFMLETLAEQEGHKYPLSDIDILSDEMRISVPIIQTIISQYGLFEIVEDSGQKFFSPKLNQWLEPYYNKVKDMSLAGQISAAKRKAKQQEQLKQLSLLDSTQHMLDTCSTNKINKEIKEKKEEKKEPLNFDNFLGKDFSVLIEDSIYTGVITCISESLSQSGKYNISYTTEKGTDTILPYPLTKEEIVKYLQLI